MPLDVVNLRHPSMEEGEAVDTDEDIAAQEKVCRDGHKKKRKRHEKDQDKQLPSKRVKSEKVKSSRGQSKKSRHRSPYSTDHQSLIALHRVLLHKKRHLEQLELYGKKTVLPKEIATKIEIV